MTVRIHTESSEEGGGVVQHSNNKMEGPSCVINHWNKQSVAHGLRLHRRRRNRLQVETQHFVSDDGTSWAARAMKTSSLIEIEQGGGVCACVRGGSFLPTGAQRVYGRCGGTLNLLTVKWQVIRFILLSLSGREISPRTPSHAHTSTPSLPTW